MNQPNQADVAVAQRGPKMADRVRASLAILLKSSQDHLLPDLKRIERYINIKESQAAHTINQRKELRRLNNKIRSLALELKNIKSMTVEDLIGRVHTSLMKQGLRLIERENLPFPSHKQNAELYEWELVPNLTPVPWGRNNKRLKGVVRGHPRHPEVMDGEPVTTSPVVRIDFKRGLAETENTVYKLMDGPFEHT